jgi:thiosulfate/3-mercaptopyruvate sulfurtransferase
MVNALVSTQWLKDHLGDENLRIFDCAVYMGYDPELGVMIRAGRDEYESAHIPSASFLNLIDDLSKPDSDVYFMMPSTEQFDRVLSEAGLGNEHQVVLYSSSLAIFWTTRMWWLLRGAASLFTNGLINRQQTFVNALTCALAPIINTKLYNNIDNEEKSA